MSVAARRYFAGSGVLFGAAVEAAGIHERRYRIGGQRVLVRTAGTELVARTDPAFEPRREQGSGGDAPPDLVVEMWDSAGSGVDIGRAPWPAEDLGPLGLVSSFCDDRFLSAVDVHTASVSLFDGRSARARFWLWDARRMAYWQAASPLRLIVSWFAATRGMQLTHAAAVGGPAGGVLLVGGAGAGKSTTSLSCLVAGLDFFGDDYCLVAPGPPPMVHGVYSTAKLRPEGLGRLPELEGVVRNLERLDREKAVLDLAPRFADRLPASAPLRAIAVPRVTGRCRVERISPGAVVRAMAPSTVFGLFGATHGTLPALARLAATVPGYLLELGDDRDEVAATVAALAGAS